MAKYYNSVSYLKLTDHFNLRKVNEQKEGRNEIASIDMENSPQIRIPCG